jgi:hypothetical protein
MGKMVGKHSLDKADWAFNLRHVEQLLRARNVLAHRVHKSAERFDTYLAVNFVKLLVKLCAKRAPKRPFGSV